MSTLLSPAPELAEDEIPWGELWPISVEVYHAMIASGLLDDHNVELLHGRLVTKMGKNPPQNVSGRRTDIALTRAAPEGWHVTYQSSLTLVDSEPEPDLMVVRGQVEDYSERNPGPSDVGLAVEVAQASLRRDRGLKRRMYAAAEIPCYWIVNLVDAVIETYADPRGGDYTVRRDYRRGEAVPLILDRVQAALIPVADLLASRGLKSTT
ncbi:MAG: Uma2 family endonuclease [Acidobacteria bacterium]|nr:Uma2 family endonuclease [Acidobacteriota bacterium]